MNDLRLRGRSILGLAGPGLLTFALLTAPSTVATPALASTSAGAAEAFAAADAQVSVDFTTATANLDRDSIGVTITGYGNQSYITNNDTHRGYVRSLDPGVMRIELKYVTPGDPTSRVVCGGSYCDDAIDAATWLAAIRQLGAEPMVILPVDGRHAAEIDVTDAVGIYRYIATATGTPVRRFIIGNETDNAGNPHNVTAVEYSRRFNLIADALRAVDPAVRLAGPGTASYNTEYLDTFLAGSGTKVDVVDFHKYAQGGTENKSEAQLLSETNEYRTVPADLRRRIDLAVPSRAGQIGIQIGEYNLDWNDDPKELTGFTTVWSAAALGNMLGSGVTAIQYGDKNGALGLTSQDDVGGIPSNQPLPIYHGIGMFTGEGLFRPFGRTMAATSSTDSEVQAFASLDSTSVVLVNTATTAKPTSVALTGLTAGTAQLWQSTASALAPHQTTGLGVAANALTLTLPARSVSTVLIEPGQGLRGAYYNTMDLTGSAVNRIDSQVNFDWGVDAPATGVNADGFSVRWAGGLQIPTAGAYTLTTTSDDGVRVWIDDTLVVDAWSNHSTRDDSGTITLSTGWHRIRMEYYDYNFDAVAKLSWAGPGLTRQIIPAANLRQSS